MSGTEEQLFEYTRSDSKRRAESVAVPLSVNRRVYNLRRFDRDFGFIEPDKSWHVKSRVSNALHCSASGLWGVIVGFLPILHWLPRYNIKEHLVSDIIAGVTIAIVHIPQGMAYASLASLEPVYGLYTSFFPTLFYMFFGTSRHVSLGVFAVVSLMVGQVRLTSLPDKVYLAAKAVAENDTASLNITSSELEELLAHPNSDLTPVAVVTALAMTVGFIQILMGMLRLDFITAYLSDQVVSGFTTGAACHVFTAQLNKILNIKLPRYKGHGALFNIYRDLITSIPDANYATVIMSFVTMIVLVVGKEFINPHVKKVINIGVPWELVVVIGGTIASYFGNFYDAYDMKIVDHIPRGLPAPELPPMRLIPGLIKDAIGIAVVAFVVTVSLGKLFAKKHHYKVDPRQELYALGFMEILCSLFRCYPASTALARSLVYEAAGAKTQLAALFTSMLLFVVLMWMGPLFKALPMCVLASIIIVALKGMFLQFSQLLTLWPVSKVDFLIWIVTFIATIVLDVRDGLIASVLFAVLTSVVRSQRPPSTILGRLQDTDIYLDVDRYKKIELVPNVCVFRFDSPLMFTNCERFRQQLFEQCRIDLVEAQQQLEEADQQGAELVPLNPETREDSGIADTATQPLTATAIDAEKQQTIACTQPSTSIKAPGHLGNRRRAKPPPSSVNGQKETEAKTSTAPKCHRYVVLDCSGFNYVDYMGIHALMELYSDLNEVGIGLQYANFKTTVRDVLGVANFYGTVPKSSLYASVHDAVVFAQSALNEQS